MPATAPLPEIDRLAPNREDAPTLLALAGIATVTAPGAPPVRLERKQAAVLAYLRHAGRTPRARLAGLLWPSVATATSRSNLRQCLVRLRRMAPGLLVEDADAVDLAPAVLLAPVDPGHAGLLDGYDYADCDDFARWLEARVDDERAGRKAFLLTALHAATRRGDFAEAQARADALLALDRESEDPYRALMEVAYLRGDFAAAVRIWDRCRNMLRQLYGVSPSAATQSLGASILAAAPAGSPPPSGAASAGAPARSVEAATQSTSRAPGGVGAPTDPAAPMLFGRAEELSALLALLRTRRLVTLIGIGGIGKTSLARAAARAEREARSADVWFVDMAPVGEPERLAGVVAHRLGLSPSADPLEALVLALRTSEALLVLDNAEHLWEAVVAVTAALLARTTRLRLLVTSRRALRLAGEQRFGLSGLATSGDLDAGDPRPAGALALFEARAAALDARFRITAGNAAAVADICRRLDGVPLAIELAAARVRVLGVNELRVRLLGSLRVLGAQATVGAPRHQTLRATFDWTHDLLAPGEQVLLRRLAVFVGGFDLALAEQVAFDAGEDAAAGPDRGTDEDDTLLDDLGALIDNSLVIASDAEPRRYRMVEVTRAYAHEKLVEAKEVDRISARHAAAIWRLFAGAEADLNEKTRGALTRGQFLRRLTPELDNLRAARLWSRSAADAQTLGAGLGLGLAASSTEALRLLGLSNEALRAMLELRDTALGSAPDGTAELFWTGLCALGTHGRLSRAELLDVIDRAERIYRRIGSARRVHVGLYRKGFALLHLGVIDDAQRAVGEMEALECVDWPARAIALRLNLQGAVDAFLGRFEASISAFERAAALLRFEPDEIDVVLNVLSNLCMSLLGAERHEEALSVASDVLSRTPSPVVRNIAQRATLVALIFLERLDEAAGVARISMPGWRNDDMLPHMLSVFAWLAYLQGRVADALRLDGAARAEVARRGLSNTPVFDRARQQLERALDHAAVAGDDVARWRREGGLLHQDDVVALCVGEPGVDALPSSNASFPRDPH